MKELSVFIDESGDFGVYNHHSPYYIVTMVFHNQDVNINPFVRRLDIELSYLGLNNLCIHTGPIIRKEEIYTDMSIDERRKIMNKLMAFFRQIKIGYKSFCIEKKRFSDMTTVSERLSRLMTQFIEKHYEEFLAFDEVKIYYDNGQNELGRIIYSVFHLMLPNSIFRKVMPSDYKLFQTADLICSLKLVELKARAGLFSKSEEAFFGNIRNFRKNYLKPLNKKEWI